MEPADSARLRRYRLGKGAEAAGLALSVLAVMLMIAMLLAYGRVIAITLLGMAAAWSFLGWTLRHSPRAWWRAKADLQAGAGLIVSGLVSRKRGRCFIGEEEVAVLQRDLDQLQPGARVEVRCGLASRLVLEVRPL